MILGTYQYSIPTNPSRNHAFALIKKDRTRFIRYRMERTGVEFTSFSDLMEFKRTTSHTRSNFKLELIYE